MPVYLAHGFRWPRNGFSGIRVHAIVHNLEDLAVEYIQNEQSKAVLLQNFRDLYPSLMMQLEDPRTGKTLDFLEQHDPEDEFSDAAVSQNYAYVCDRVIPMAAGNTSVPVSPNIPQDDQRSNANTTLRVPGNRPRTSSSPHRPATSKPKPSSSAGSSPIPRHNPAVLSLNVEDAMSNGPVVTPQAWEALAEIRDKIAEGEKIGWWVIYNGDPDRGYNAAEDGSDYDEEVEEEEEVEGAKTPTQTESYIGGVLGQPLPSMLPPDLKDLVLDENKANKENKENQSPIGMAVPHPPPPAPPLERPLPSPNDATPSRPKSSKSFSNPLKKKSSKAHMQPNKHEEIPDPPKLKEIGKKEGFRSKFFGRSGDKK